MEEMLAAFLDGPVRRIAHYSAVHAIYSAFDTALSELCRAVAGKGRQPKRSPRLSRFFDFLCEEIGRQTGQRVSIPADENDYTGWFLGALVVVRHCIAHAMGDVTLLRSDLDQGNVRAAAELLGLAVSMTLYHHDRRAVLRVVVGRAMLGCRDRWGR